MKLKKKKKKSLIFFKKFFTEDFPIDRSFPISQADLLFLDELITLLSKMFFELIFIFDQQDMLLKYKMLKWSYRKSAGEKINTELTVQKLLNV